MAAPIPTQLCAKITKKKMKRNKNWKQKSFKFHKKCLFFFSLQLANEVHISLNKCTGSAHHMTASTKQNSWKEIYRCHDDTFVVENKWTLLLQNANKTSVSFFCLFVLLHAMEKQWDCLTRKLCWICYFIYICNYAVCISAVAFDCCMLCVCVCWRKTWRKFKISVKIK